MAYVIKDAHGIIKAGSPNQIDSADWVFIAGDSREYLDFLEASLTEQNPFRESDIELARVLEDLISLLIERDVIHFTDFPEQAQQRLIKRQNLRLSDKKLNLIDNETNLF
ncbi:MAG: hypothetical protein NTX38_18815 [Methylobacter sp.]|nr:hypothetical protein [Methylobacter sp.]